MRIPLIVTRILWEHRWYIGTIIGAIAFVLLTGGCATYQLPPGDRDITIEDTITSPFFTRKFEATYQGRTQGETVVEPAPAAD